MMSRFCRRWCFVSFPQCPFCSSLLTPFLWWHLLELPFLLHASEERHNDQVGSCPLTLPGFGCWKCCEPKLGSGWGLAKEENIVQSWYWSVVPESSAGFITDTFKAGIRPHVTWACPHHMNPGKGWCWGCSLGLARWLSLPASLSIPASLSLPGRWQSSLCCDL